MSDGLRSGLRSWLSGIEMNFCVEENESEDGRGINCRAVCRLCGTDAMAFVTYDEMMTAERAVLDKMGEAVRTFLREHLCSSPAASAEP